jgi:hypothetical protein
MNLSHILLWVLVFIVIVWFFESIQQSYMEQFEEEKEKEKEKIYPQRPHIGVSPVVPELRTIKKRQPACDLIRENDLKTNYYIEKTLNGKDFERCPQPTKAIKKFNKDFFKFRDFTMDNTSIRLDAVDKVINLQLSGNLSQARNISGKRIRDIYDETTMCGPNLNQKTCVRVPQFDNTMHDGYVPNNVTGMHNVRDHWQYPSESSMNGGKLAKNLYGNDLSFTGQFPALGQ